MKKSNIIKKNYEIKNVINKKNCVRNRYFNIYFSSNDFNYHRFAVCVSTKIGNAVTRNKVKRQVKDIIDKSNLVFKTNVDYVIIIKKEINEIKFNDIKTNLINLLKKITE